MDNEKRNLTTNNKSSKPKKKQYILKKDKDFYHLLKVKESFNDPNIYFQKQQKMEIGRFPSKTKKNNFQPIHKSKSLSLTQEFASPIQVNRNSEQKLNKNLLPRSKSFIIKRQSNRKTIESKSKVTNNNSYINNYNNSQPRTKKNLKIYKNNSENITDRHEKGIHYQIKSLSDILTLFRSYKNLEKENKFKGKNIIFGNNKISNEIIKEVGKNFSEQEKILNQQEKLKNDTANFSKLLSKKINRDEKDLIYNKIEEFRLKKQLIDLMEKAKNVHEKFGDIHWIANLRRPKTHKDIRFIYSNTKNILSPDMIIDYADKDVEFISVPNLHSESKYANLVKNFNDFKKTHKYKYPNFKKMAQIETIKGKKLLEKELNEIKDNISINKYRLYEDPFELKKNNVDDLICKENYDVKFRIQRNRSYIYEENKLNITNQKKQLYRSQSALRLNKNKDKIGYLEKALKMYQKEMKEKNSKIKILSYK